MRCHDFDYLYICLQIAVMSLIVLVLVTNIVGLSSANPSCSHITNDGYTFDLSPMERLSGNEDFTKTVKVGETVEFVYRMNVCHDTIQKCQNGGGAVTESLRIPAGETCRVLGRTEGMVVEDMEYPPDADNPHGEGVRIKYTNGDVCDPVERSKREAWVEIQCSVTSQGAGALVEVKKVDSCKTVLKMKSRHACSVTSLGTGTTLLIFIFLALATYCTCGAFLNWKIYNRTGVDLIPHQEFWLEFPSYVKDGVQYTKLKVFSLTNNDSMGSRDDPF